MKKELVQKIAGKLRKKLEETEELKKIYEAEYNKDYWKKLLDSIFDECRINIHERRLIGNAAIQTIREDLRKEKEALNIFTDEQKARIEKGKAEAAQQDEITEAIHKGEIPKEDVPKYSQYYR